MEFVKNEQKILKFWEENKIFEKLRQKIKGKKPWSFLDGPITANNPMGVHHAWGRTYKDLFQRYKAMQGFDLRFQNGFDCQGLWVEVEVEKELGFKNKKDIEKYGIEKFVNKCKERVFKYSKIQTEQSIRLGQWMDWENSYYTMSDENNYAIWHFLKKCKEKGLLYKGRDSVPWCPRCGTAISQHEILTEEYKEITHKAVFFKLPVSGEKNTFFLVWTTTPWTLPGNVALAVHPEFEYVMVKSKVKSQNSKFQVKSQNESGEKYILLKEKVDEVFGKGNYEVIKTIMGKELKGFEYEGLFDELEAVAGVLNSYKHKVILWKEVTEEEGTGIVHIASGGGREDFQLSKEHKLPVIDLTDGDSNYGEGFGELTGKFAGSDEVRTWIFKNLEEKRKVFKIEDYKHRYPTCWRCKSELIFRLVEEWYIAMDKLRKPLMQTAKKIKWIPSFGLERELDWLKNMQDWLISKKRYWGLALPIYECKKCSNFEVIGSRKELGEKAVEGWEEFEGKSPHRPWVDKVKIKCSKCGEIISRIPDVGTPWLDAGIVPFSTINEENKSSINRSELRGEMPSYFRDKKYWKKWFPADFVCESFPGQFKNWFYVLLVQSQVLEGKEPFCTLFGYSTVVDEKGEEMHKSKGNAIWFNEAVEKIGADVMRWMYVKQNPVSNLRFGYNVARETKRKILTLLNCYTFFETYFSKNSELKTPTFAEASLDRQKLKLQLKTKSLLDKWIVSRLNRLIKRVTGNLDKFDAARASGAIEDFFIEDLSLWYIRRSRQRFQNPESEEEREKAASVLYYVLLNLAKLIAPMLPFLAEEVYQKLKADKMPSSIHLYDWPKAEKKAIDEKLEEQMAQVRNIVSLALAKRTELGLRVRQPLASLKINEKNVTKSHDREKTLQIKNEPELLTLIKEEVNVKNIVFDEKVKEEVELDIKLTPELKEEGYVREIIRHIQDLRKKAGLIPRDRVIIYYASSEELNKLIAKNKKQIIEQTKSKLAKENPKRKGEFLQQKQIKIENENLWLAISPS